VGFKTSANNPYGNKSYQIRSESEAVRHVLDPLSGYFGFPLGLIEDIHVNGNGYRLLLEILVNLDKANIQVPVKEIPFTVERTYNKLSKTDRQILAGFTAAIWTVHSRVQVGIVSLFVMAVRLSLIFIFVEYYHISYLLTLSIAVLVAALGNFVPNNKITLKERTCS
jgi:hypothetical protein